MNIIVIDPNEQTVERVSFPVGPGIEVIDVMNSYFDPGFGKISKELENGDRVITGRHAGRDVSKLAFRLPPETLVFFGRAIIVRAARKSNLLVNCRSTAPSVKKYIVFLNASESSKVRFNN